MKDNGTKNTKGMNEKFRNNNKICIETNFCLFFKGITLEHNKGMYGKFENILHFI